MSGPDVFLSYNHPDEPRARQFAGALEEEGFSVWWDATLRSGETFDEVIERALLEARAVVVLWSPNSVTSRWVRAEATEADRMGKLVPAMIAPCKRPIVFEMTQTADLSHWQGDRTDKAWRAFVADVRHVVEGKGRTTPPSLHAAHQAPPAVQEPRSPKTERRMVIALAVVAAIALLAWFYFRPDGSGPRLTEQPVQVVTFTAQGGPEAALLAENLKNTSQEVLGQSGFRTRAVESASGKDGLALQGSVIASGGRLKAFVQMLHMPSGETVWSDQFEDDAAEPDRVAIAAAVASAEALAHVRDAEQQEGLKLGPRDVASFIEGGMLTTVANRVQPGKAAEVYSDLVRRLPQSAHAHAMHALTMVTADNSPQGRKKLAQLKAEEIDRAIALDPAAAGAAFDMLAGLEGRNARGDFVRQEDVLLDGLRQAPSFPFLHMRECEVLMNVGRISDARPYCERANAMRPTAAPIAWRMAWQELLANRPGPAEQSAEQAERFYPNAPIVLATKLAVAGFGPDPNRALQVLPRLREVSPDFGDAEAAAVEAFVDARQSGSKASADKAARLIVAAIPRGALWTGQAIMMLTMLGQGEDALAIMLKPVSDGSFGPDSGTFLFAPQLAPLRSDPRFWQSIAHEGYFEYWRKRDKWPDFCGAEIPLDKCKAMAAAAEKT